MAICDYCKETIPDGAIKCKFCGEPQDRLGKIMKMGPYLSFLLILLIFIFVLIINGKLSSIKNSGGAGTGNGTATEAAAVKAIHKILDIYDGDISSIDIPDEEEIAELEIRIEDDPEDIEAQSRLLLYQSIEEYSESSAETDEGESSSASPGSESSKPAKKSNIAKSDDSEVSVPAKKEEAKTVNTKKFFKLTPLSERTSCPTTDYLRTKIKNKIEYELLPSFKNTMLSRGVNSVSMSFSIAAHRGQLKVFGYEARTFRGSTNSGLSKALYDKLKSVADKWNVKNHSCNDAVIEFEFILAI